MDPRHPEQAISRMRELMKQYDRIEADISKAMTSAKLAQLEREGGLVVQEICLVAPRIHEAMMQVSRQRRHDISRGFIEPKPIVIDSLVETELDKEINKALEPIEQYVAPNQAETVIVEPKPRKKKTTKKKTKKAE